jgi:hypothetical protein
MRGDGLRTAGGLAVSLAAALAGTGCGLAGGGCVDARFPMGTTWLAVGDAIQRAHGRGVLPGPTAVSMQGIRDGGLVVRLRSCGWGFWRGSPRWPGRAILDAQYGAEDVGGMAQDPSWLDKRAACRPPDGSSDAPDLYTATVRAMNALARWEVARGAAGRPAGDRALRPTELRLSADHEGDSIVVRVENWPAMPGGHIHVFVPQGPGEPRVSPGS